MSKRYKPIDSQGISKIVSEIRNNPLIRPEELMIRAKELGYNPLDLIDAALGAVKYEKSSARLDQPFEDFLNSVYENDPTPGRRYIMEPSEAITPRGKEVAKALEGNLGVAQSMNFGRSRALPDYVAIRPAYKDIEKLQSLSHAGHELEHQVDYLIRPNFQMKTDKPFKEGHHYRLYEPEELIREARDLPKDARIEQEIVKQSKKAMLKPSLFSRLRSLLGPIAAGAGLYSALKSKDATAAALEGAALVDPTGIADAAAEVNRRLKMSPEEQQKTAKEDYYSAMPLDIANEQRMLDELEDDKELTVEKDLKKRKKELGYE